jgi:hypothetical protein
MSPLGSLIQFLRVLAREPPFRLFAQKLLRSMPRDVRTDALWELHPYPQYLVGVLAAADEALEQGEKRIAVMEFGVAGGNGLIALERSAAAVEKETGIQIAVYGFDTGSGLPPLCGDYRDHPDFWQVSDYPMDAAALRARLTSRTELILGDIRETVPVFAANRAIPPVGFVSIDLDLYSSAREAFKLFARPEPRMLRRTYLYMDDVAGHRNHQFAGELLAIREFNEAEVPVKIDLWRGLRPTRVFPESYWIEKMYVAHDLTAISAARVDRPPERLALRPRRPEIARGMENQVSVDPGTGGRNGDRQCNNRRGGWVTPR